MAFSTEKVLDDLRNASDWDTFHRIVNYIHAHSSDYSPHDYDIIMDNIQELQDRKFNPKDCSQIKNILYITNEGYTSREWVPMGHDYSMNLCSTAHDLGIPLHEYLFESYPDMRSFRIEKASPTAYERELAQGVLTTMEERRARKLAVPQPSAEAGISVGINVADLLERQRSEMQELIDAARRDNQEEMSRLRESINRLQSMLEAKDTVSPTPVTVKEIRRVLDSSQFAYFQRKIVSLGIPSTVRRIAKGEYEVVFRAASPEEEQNILGFLTDVEANAPVKVTPRGHIRPAGYEDVIRGLCQDYERQAGMPCGLSRTGALSTLAERLIEYAQSRGTEWDKMFDINSLDLFAKRGQIYTREQADEAFNNAIRQIEGKVASRRMVAEEEAECDPEILLDYMLDYDAINVLETDYLKPLPDALKEKRTEAVNALSRCGYYPNRLDEMRGEGDITYGEYGTSYHDQLTGRIESYLNRYRGA